MCYKAGSLLGRLCSCFEEVVSSNSQFNMRFLLLVEPLEGAAVHIMCHPNTTVEDIKAQVEEKMGTPAEKQRLFFNGVELIKPNKIIQNLCKVEIVTLQLLQNTEQYIAVRESGRKTVILKFYPDDTALDILEKTKTSSIHSKCLMFQGRELHCGSSLSAQSIGSGDMLHVVIKHRKQVYVRTFDGGIAIPCSPHDTIKNLKAAIQMKEGIPSTHQHLLKLHTTSMEEYEDSEGVPLQHLPQLLVKEDFLFVQNESSHFMKGIILKYEPSETVWSVKMKLHRSMGIPPELQEMTFSKRVLDNCHKLEHFKIKNHATLDVKELYQSPVKVELITGGTAYVLVKPNDTVESVKEKLQEEFAIPTEKQRLFFHGRELLGELQYRSEFSQLLLVRQDIDIFYVQDCGSLHVLAYNPHDTVKDIKLRLQETYIMQDSHKMILLFDGKTLEDSQELSKCGVRKESTVIFNMMPEYQFGGMMPEYQFGGMMPEYQFGGTFGIKVFHNGSVLRIEVQCHCGESVGNIKTFIQKEKDVDIHDHEIVGVPLCGTGPKQLEDSMTIDNFFSFRDPLYCVAKPWPQVLINVKNGLTGKEITVEAYPFHTVAELKAKIEVKEGFKISQQCLLLADQELMNECTLDDCNLSVGCTLVLIPDTHKRCPVFITIPSIGETLSLIAEPTTTIEMIKAETEYLGGIPREQCTLSRFHERFSYFGGSENLKNGVKVGDMLNRYFEENILHLEAKRDALPNVGPVRWSKLLNPVPPCGPFLIPVYVCLSDVFGQTAAIVMEVYPTITVEEFIAALHQRDFLSIPLNEMQPKFSNETLEPYKKLMDYSITRGSVLHIKLKDTFWHYMKSPLEGMVSTDLTPSILPSAPSCVPLFVQIPGRNVIPIVCTPNTTVIDVKNKIAQKEGISMKQQHLVFAGRLLENGRTLRYYSLRRENIIHVMLSVFQTAHLLVQTLEGETVTLECDVTDTVEHVKATLNEKLGKPIELQCLFFANKMLENGKTLQDHNIQSNSYSTLLLKPEPWFSLRVKSSSKWMTIEVQPNDSIKEVKKKIRCIEGTPTHKQILFFGDRLEDTRTVGDYGILPWDIIALQRPSDRPVILVKSTTNELMSVDYVETMSVLEVKTHIYTTRKIPVEQQSLFFKGLLLENNQTLKDCEIHQRNTLHLIIHLHDSYQLSIEAFNNTMTSLNVAPIHTVQNIKLILWHRLGIPPDQQCLYLGNEPESELNNDCLMSSYPKDCTLCLAQRPKAVFIRRNSKPSIKLDWPNHNYLTASEIQSVLKEKVGIQAEKLTLALGPTVLRDEQRLCSYSILNQMRKESYCLQLAVNHAFFIVCPATGETVVVEYSSYDSVRSIHTKITTALGDNHVATQNHYLLTTAVGKPFDKVDDKMLENLKMTKTTTLYLIPPYMKIFVTTHTGLWTILEVRPLDTMSMLKLKIQQHWGFPVMQQQLSFKEEHLVDEKNLFNYNVQDESTLHLELLPWKEDQISIEMPAKTITLEVNPLETIQSIKSTVEQREGISTSHQHIYSADYSELKDEEKTLSELLVKNHTTLRLLARPKLLLLLMCNGKTIQVKWQKGDLATVLDLKVALERQEGIPAESQQIFLGGDCLEDDHSLFKYNILSQVSECDCHFLLATGPIMLIREYGTSHYTPLDYHPDHTISDVKKIIEEKCIYHGKFDLVESWYGYVLKEHKCLSSCKIPAGRVLELVPDKPIKVLILFPSGETVNMSVNVLDDEYKVMFHIWDELDPIQIGCHPKHAHLFSMHTGKHVKRLYDSNIVEGSILCLQVILPPVLIGASFSSISLNILSTGKTFGIRVGHDERVDSVKLRIERTEGIPFCLQQITLEGQELDDDKLLGHYSIKDGATLKVALTGHLLTIKMHMGKAIYLVYNPNDSISEIKKQVCERERISPANQMFVFNGKELQGDQQVLKDCNVGPNSTIHLLRKHRMQIRVVTHVGEGSSIQLPVQPGDTIESIKQLIQVFKQLPPTQQRIFHQGCELNDWMTLSDFCIQPGSTVYLVPQQLHIWTSENSSIVLRYDENDSVASIKIAIQEEEGIPAERQDLLFGEIKLEDYHTLKDYGIRNEYFLYLQLIEAGTSESAVKKETVSKLSVPDLTNRPKLYQLQRLEGHGGKIVEVIDKTAANWEKLALALHFEEHILGIVSRDNTSVVQACQDVLSRWLRGEARQPVNWITLIQSLREMKFDILGEDLELALSTDIHT